MQLLSVKVIQTPEAFAALRLEWQRLNQESEKGCFFTDWNWLFTWWEIYPSRHDSLSILSWYDGSELVAIAPFYIKKVGLWRRELRFIGTGEQQEKEVATEYMDVICRQHIASRLKRQFIGDMKLLACDWEVARFENVLASSFIRDVFRHSRPALEVGYFERCIGKRYAVHLPDSWQTFLLSLNSKSFSRKLTRELNRINDNEMSVKVYTDETSCQDLLTRLIPLHQKSWGRKGKAGAFASFEFKAFHARLLSSVCSQKQVVMLAIFHDGEPMALIYSFAYKDTFYYYQSGFDYAQKALKSPGVSAHAEVVRYAISQGYTYYDMMKGGMTSYKSSYLNSLRDEKVEEMFHLTLSKRCWPVMRLANYLKRSIRGLNSCSS